MWEEALPDFLLVFNVSQLVWQRGMERGYGKGYAQIKIKDGTRRDGKLGNTCALFKKEGEKEPSGQANYCLGRYRLLFLLISLLLNLMTLFSLFVFYWMPKLYSGHFGGGQLPLSLLKQWFVVNSDLSISKTTSC